MKRLIQTQSILFSLLIVVAGCSSGKKAYQKGDYYSAVVKAVDRLRSNPNHKKSVQALENAYPLAIKYYEDQIRNQLSADNPDKWVSVVSSYNTINNMANEINRSPGALAVIPNPVTYYSELADAKESAAEEQYNRGVEFLAMNTRESAKDAYYRFVNANGYVPGFKDVNDKIDEAKYIATLKVVVDQIPSVSKYSVSSDFFQDQVESYLRSGYASEFVRFYNFKEAEEENLNPPDQILRLFFDDFVVGETHVEKTVREVSQDSVKVGEATIGDSTVNVYNTVKAELTTYRKEVISNGRMAMEIIDGFSNGVLSSQKFTGEFVWYSEWGNFNGDGRALTKEQLAICNSEEVPPPPPQDLFLEFTRPIYSQLTNSLDSYYGRF